MNAPHADRKSAPFAHRPANIAAVLPEMAAARPDAPAIHFPSGRHPDGTRRYTTWTYAELDAQSDHIAQALEAAGIGRGVRTALMVKPSLEFFALTFAIFKAGAVPVMIDPGIGVANIKRCLARARPEAFIGIPAAHAARALLGWGRGSVRTLVTVGRRWAWGGTTLAAMKRRCTPDPNWKMAATSAEETAAILFTSGSTGTPKGVVYRHATFLAQVDAIRAMYDIRPGEIDLPTFPLFALFDPALGMTTVVPDMDFSRPATIDPSMVKEAVETFGITNMFGSPAVVNAVARWAEREGARFSSLRRVISAGAPVPPATLARMRACIPDAAEIVTPYGATESLPVASIESREVLDFAAARTDAGHGVCVGHPVPTITLRVIKISDAPLPTLQETSPCEAGEIGEIIVRGEVVTHAYFEQPDATTLAKIEGPDGEIWHRMGDVGYLDEDGRLWFCGRKSHRVRTQGGPRFTVPAEGIFNAHPAVFRAALVGVVKEHAPHETPVICVELEPEARSQPRETIERELRGLARAHELTEDIDNFLFHPAFPVDIRHNAKIDRPALARWAAGALR